MSQLGWTLAADWQLDAGLVLAWPKPDSDWAPYWPAIQHNLLAIAQKACRSTKVWILVASPSLRSKAWQFCQQQQVDPNLFEWRIMGYQEIWLRDTCPLWLHYGEHYFSWLGYRVSGWGGQYYSHNDQLLNHQLFNGFATAQFPKCDVGIEGGAISSNGHGIAITTQFCLQHEGRCNSQDWSLLSQQLTQALGLEQLWFIPTENDIFLPGDDTHGHIDNLVHWVDRYTLLVADSDSNHSAYPALQKLKQHVRHWQDNMPKLQVIYFPLPTTQQQLPYSYLNAIRLNHQLLVPIFSLPEDNFALDLYRQIYPQLDIVAINAKWLIQQGGALHCCSHQFPKNN